MFRRGVLRLAGLLMVATGGIAACGPSEPSLPPFDPDAAVAATAAAETARLAIRSFLDVGAGPRELATAEGVVDLGKVTGTRTGRIATNPFPPPGEDPLFDAVETRTIEGRGFERSGSVTPDGPWREVDGSLGTFLAVGNRETTFEAVMEEVLGAAVEWRAVGREDVRGEATSRYQGIPVESDRGPIEVWVDDEGRIRRLTVERAGAATTNTMGTSTLEFWDFGVEVDVERPAP